jgi:antibiotic biosynthesis monooxygenase (ABM) superfamily enzyme
MKQDTAPLTFRKKMLLRHKNPAGLLLRVLTYLTIGISLWHHNIILISVCIFVDLMNWFLMPMVNPKKENRIVRQIVQAEINWIKSPWNSMKVFSIVVGICLFMVSSIGLWQHDWIMLIIGFVLITILKQLMLKRQMHN